MVFWIMVDQTQRTLQHPQLWFTGDLGGSPGPPGLSHALTGLLPPQLALGNEMRQVVAALTTHLTRTRRRCFLGDFDMEIIWKSYGNHLKHEDIMGIYIYGKNEYRNHMENPLYIYTYWFIIIWRFPRSLGHRGYSQLSSKSWLTIYDHLSIETHGDFGIPHFRTSPICATVNRW
jgi:hypothetical protein